MHQLSWDAPRLLNLSGAYWSSCLLQAAVRLDLFSALAAGPRAEADLAAGLGCQPRAFNMLVTALAASGFLTRQPEGVSAPPDILQYLSRSSPDYVGFIIMHHANIMPSWAKLAQAVRQGGPVRERNTLTTDDPDERRDFLLGMFNVARQQAGLIADTLDLSGRAHLLDLGGGPGAYAVHFCRANPDLRATIFDLPTTEPIARQIVEAYGLQERIDFVGGDYLNDPLPRGDVVWLSQVLHGESQLRAERLLARAMESLPAGGLLCVQEFMLDDERSGPVHPALFALTMLLETNEGQTYTAGEISAMMIKAGARSVHPLPVGLPQGCRVLVGEK
jgi:predicted O-methyltransferase YrrM